MISLRSLHVMWMNQSPIHTFAELHKSRALDNGLGASSNYVDEAMGFHSDRSVSIPNIWFFTIVKSDAVNDSVLTVQILS